MKIILLPGADKGNKVWARELAMFLRPTADSIQVHHHNHWYEGGGFHIEHEKENISRLLNDKNTIVIGHLEGADIAIDSLKNQKTLPKAFIAITKKNNSSEIDNLEKRNVKVLTLKETNKSDNLLKIAQNIEEFIKTLN